MYKRRSYLKFQLVIGVYVSDMKHTHVYWPHLSVSNGDVHLSWDIETYGYD